MLIVCSAKSIINTSNTLPGALDDTPALSDNPPAMTRLATMGNVTKRNGKEPFEYAFAPLHSSLTQH